jgi:hypothetical protein
VRSLSLAGADRCTDNKLLAKKCHLGFARRTRSEQFDEQSAEQLQEVDHPEARIAHRGICASPDAIFGSHNGAFVLDPDGHNPDGHNIEAVCRHPA